MTKGEADMVEGGTALPRSDDSGAAGVPWGVRAGRLIFPRRHWIHVALGIFLWCCFLGVVRDPWVTWLGGSVAVVLGAALRLWCIRHMGRSARTSRLHASHLVISGPYAYVRNPIYLANLCILAGFGFYSQLLWFVPVALLLGFVQYHLIVLSEEDVIRKQYGEAYEAYLEGVPRWIPRLTRWGVKARGVHSLGDILYREKALLRMAVVGGALVASKHLLLSRFFG